MKTFERQRLPLDIISYAVWRYRWFNLSHRDVESLLAERGITVRHESARLWHPKHSLRSWGRLCIKFGALYTRREGATAKRFFKRILR
jgi:putative transposase